MSKNEKDELYKSGLLDGRGFFIQKFGPAAVKDMKIVLEYIYRKLIDELGIGSIHLRVNVAMPTFSNKRRLRIMYTYNMDDDTDDQLEFESGSCCGGKCWEKHEPVICNMEDAKNTYQKRWNMSKYQQRLVRSELKSLLSVPIFNFDCFDESVDDINNEVIGVLSFDSDVDLLTKFANPKIQQVVADYAQIIYRQLKSY